MVSAFLGIIFVLKCVNQVSRLGMKVVTAKPEYDDCKNLSLSLGLPLKVVLQESQILAATLLS